MSLPLLARTLPVSMLLTSDLLHHLLLLPLYLLHRDLFLVFAQLVDCHQFVEVNDPLQLEKLFQVQHQVQILEQLAVGDLLVQLEHYFELLVEAFVCVLFHLAHRLVDAHDEELQERVTALGGHHEDLFPLHLEVQHSPVQVNFDLALHLLEPVVLARDQHFQVLNLFQRMSSVLHHFSQVVPQLLGPLVL